MNSMELRTSTLENELKIKDALIEKLSLKPGKISISAQTTASYNNSICMFDSLVNPDGQDHQKFVQANAPCD